MHNDIRPPSAARSILLLLAPVFALGAGALLPLALAPFDVWPVSLFATGLLALLIRGLPRRQLWWRTCLFGLGMFGTGVSWVYVSIHDFGLTGVFLAALMTGAFVAFLALVFALPFVAVTTWTQARPLLFCLGFAALWVLGEWSRSWFLTGFPWLFVGYGHIHSPLSGWAPVGGVYLVSFLTVFSASVLALLLPPIYRKLTTGKDHPWASGLPLVPVTTGVFTIWLMGAALTNVNWTSSTPEDRLTVSIVQPNIPLVLKWNPLYRPQIVRTLLDLTEHEWRSDIILWPEAAVPFLYNDASGFLEELNQFAAPNHAALITGLLYDDLDEDKYYNAIMGLGAAKNIYFKQRLVPFGEYVPLENLLRGLIAFFDLPNSVIHRGPANQKGIQVDGFSIAPYICYEVVYPDLVVDNLRDAELIVTISNDAWFGKSIGPLQHFQMAQMRALETGRYVIRGTNTGVSGIIDPKGRITLSGDQFVDQTLRGEVYRTRGHTPFSQTGSWPLVSLCLLLLFFANRKHQR